MKKLATTLALLVALAAAAPVVAVAKNGADDAPPVQKGEDGPNHG